jgi:hypothetical protein
VGVFYPNALAENQFVFPVQSAPVLCIVVAAIPVETLYFREFPEARSASWGCSRKRKDKN